jgi:radical SAM protein with 4Fe4S-binding SPASM domain
MEVSNVYFKTGSHCYIVQGERQASLYDLSENKMLRISPADALMLLELNRGVPVEQVDNINYILLSQLIDQGMGNYYSHNAYIEKVRFGLPPSIRDFAKNRVRISNLYLNINDECNLDCSFCNTDSVVHRMTGCKRYDGFNQNNLMEEKDYRIVLQQSHKLGCRSLHIIGGEPLLQWDLLSVILAEARQVGYSNIFIYTNLMDVGELNWEELAGASLVIHASSHNQDLTNRMIGNHPDFSNFYENMNKLKNTGISFYFNVVLNKINYIFREEIVDFYKHFNPLGMQLSFIHEIGEDPVYNELLFSDKGTQSCFTDLSFFHNVDFHPCLNGKLSVFRNGDVTVCPMMRNETIGNVLKDSFKRIADQRDYQEYWTYTLDKVDSCRSCSSRYACSDCRAIESSAGGSLSSKVYCKQALKESLV